MRACLQLTGGGEGGEAPPGCGGGGGGDRDGEIDRQAKEEDQQWGIPPQCVFARGREGVRVSLPQGEGLETCAGGDATIATSERKCIGKVHRRFDRRKVAEMLSRHPPHSLLRIL